MKGSTLRCGTCGQRRYVGIWVSNGTVWCSACAAQGIMEALFEAEEADDLRGNGYWFFRDERGPGSDGN